MPKLNFLTPLLAACFLAFSSLAHAQTTTAEYDFGKLVGAGPYEYYLVAPNQFDNNPFAHLTVVDSGTGYADYTLSVSNNLFSNFGPDAYVRSISFDYTPTPSPRPISTFISSNLTGMTAESFNGLVGWLNGSFEIDFGTGFGIGPGFPHLGENSWVKWSVTGLDSGLGSNYSLANSFVKVAGISLNGGKTAVYAPIPEPETYAMLLAGLVLFGVTVLRRKLGNT